MPVADNTARPQEEPEGNKAGASSQSDYFGLNTLISLHDLRVRC